MRNVKLLLVALGLLFFVVACGGSETTEPTAEEVAQEVVVATPTLAVVPTLPPPVISVDGEVDGGVEEEVAPPVAAEQEVVSAIIRPWPQDRFGYGTQLHGNATVGDPIVAMDGARNQLGMDWVKAQIQWWLVKPEPTADQWFFYDGVIDEANKAGLNVMLSVVGAPAWTRAAGGEHGPPDDYNEYAKFLTEMINRYPGKIGAIEVWNEQNLDREWQTANGVNPEDYVRFLQVAHDAIKAADPNIIVISGALAPTGDGDWIRWADDFSWMDRALSAGLLNFACQVH